MRVKSRMFYGTARVFTDPGQIANFLELRCRRHPRMMSAMLRGEGIRLPPERAALEAYAVQLALAVIEPD